MIHPNETDGTKDSFKKDLAVWLKDYPRVDGHITQKQPLIPWLMLANPGITDMKGLRLTKKHASPLSGNNQHRLQKGASKKQNP